ncbi:Beta-barrel assembly machine subunit BamA [Abditibacterium utsteinense]|uniref:Beta-barrel assembly machine subunit BamA n=1 Tax=Abditibacterium utsteinense TaxID=1960156 RepID=A0A2S8SPQ0_9BACT|nr:BamA/TamA family outer membrane protein [Abditibacterium utsteinense]PQV62777.1 Beta-barrel assembly machine subunit BamA [Abditibacterium utsteinense]
MIRPFTAPTPATSTLAAPDVSHFVSLSLGSRLTPVLGLGAALCISQAASAAPQSVSKVVSATIPNAVAAIKTKPSAFRQTTQIRLAQLTQGTSNTPAAAPQENPPRLEIPVGPDQAPADGAPAAPPPDATAPAPPQVMAPPQTTPDVPPVIGNLAESEGREITEVRIVGNRVIPAETILAQVRTQRGAAFSARQAELDRGRVDQLGFFATVQSQVSPDVTQANKVVVTFIVQENRVISAFKFVNASSIPDADIVPVLTSKIGVVLNRNNVNLDVAAVQKLYSNRGFAVLVQSAQLDESGTLVFTLQEARISRVELSGLSKTRPALIRRQIRVKSGDPFDASKIRRDLNRVYDLGFFEDATFKVDDDPNLPGSVIVTYLLKEKRTGQLSFGIGFDSRSRLSGFASVQESNLKGTGKRVGASLETGSRRNYELSFGNPFIGEKNASFDVSVYQRSIFREPRLVNLLTGGGGGGAVINPDGTITFDGRNSGTNTFSYEEQRTGGRVNFTKPLDYNRNRTLLFGYRNEQAKLFQRGSDNGVIPATNNGVPLDSSGRISAFSAGLLRDVRDLRSDPSRGSRQQLILEQGTKLLGDTTFTKLDADFRFYVPLMPGETLSSQPKLVFATRFVGGRSLNQLPSFEQYFVGGSDTVRGYNSDEQFGDNQFYTNFELRYRFQSKIQLVGFVDAGSAFGGRFSTSQGVDALVGYGAGVRLQTPIGPVRLDLAKGSGGNGVQTHFGIGPSF